MLIDRLDEAVSVVGDPPARALRWTVDGDHTRFGFLLVVVAYAVSGGAGIAYTSQHQATYAAFIMFVAAVYLPYLWNDYQVCRQIVNEPGYRVKAHPGVVWLRCLFAVNIAYCAFQTVLVGEPPFPVWTFLADAGIVFGAYLMYLPAAARGRKEAVAALFRRATPAPVAR